MDISGLRGLFDSEDPEGKGFITMPAVRRVASKSGLTLSAEEMLVLQAISGGKVDYPQLNSYLQVVGCGLSYVVKEVYQALQGIGLDLSGSA